ncbi:MAG: hypothetical protein JO110_01405, partial [Acetobacteraceae bacterium]|nr:hypothetical protein [Acetobacteraceae bacterium]
LALPALAGIPPVVLSHGSLERPLDIGGGPQAEQIWQTFPLGACHHRLIASFGIAAHQGGPACPAKTVEQRPAG